jgi:hypothetical protein
MRRPFVNAESQVRDSPRISGHAFDLGAGHSIAIYERNREWCVAEFRHGSGEFMAAGAWFRFRAEPLRYSHGGRAALPLSPEMLEQIEQLHRQGEAGQETALALPRQASINGRRWVLTLQSWARGIASRASREAN